MTAIRKIAASACAEGAGIRELTEEELLLVAGGGDTIVVTGYRDTYDYFDYNWYFYDPYGYDNYDYGGGGGGGGGDDTSNAEPEHASEAEKTALEGTVAALEQDLKNMIDKVGDFDIKIGDLTFKASDLLNSLEKFGNLLDAIEAVQLTNDLINGDASLGDAVGFLAAFAIAGGLAAAGAAPLTVFAVSTAAGYFIPGAVDGIVNALETGFNNMIEAAENNLGYTPSDPSWPSAIQEWDFIMHLLGIPHEEPNPYGDPYNGGGGGGGGWNEYYYIP